MRLLKNAVVIGGNRYCPGCVCADAECRVPLADSDVTLNHEVRLE
jgi:hypothetical protein